MKFLYFLTRYLATIRKFRVRKNQIYCLFLVFHKGSFITYFIMWVVEDLSDISLAKMLSGILLIFCRLTTKIFINYKNLFIHWFFFSLLFRSNILTTSHISTKEAFYLCQIFYCNILKRSRYFFRRRNKVPYKQYSLNPCDR